MKIGLAILHTKDWEQLADIVFPNAEVYCAKHGYDFLPISTQLPYDGYEKLLCIKSLFAVQKYDVIWSMDLDTLITNHKIKIENFLDEEHDFFICKDYNSINAGSFIIKKSEWSNDFIKYCLHQKGWDKMYCEQNAFEAYMNDFANNNTKIKILPHPSINSYHYNLYPDIPQQTHEQGNWEEGDFVLHLPGTGLQTKIDILKNTKITL